MSAWVELSCRIPAALYPELESALAQLDVRAITAADGDTEIYSEPGIATTSEWNVFVLTALFDASVDRAAVADTVHNIVGADLELTFTALAERVWAESWKEHWQPQPFANDLWICPTWCEPPTTARHVLRIDPGRAFGTGTHETTALCLDWLTTDAALAGRQVIDFGCGSGILALAAACFGAAEVDAVDIDEDVLAVAQDNIALNGFSDRIRVATPDALTGRRADVLVANILQEPLLALAPSFATLLVPGGRLALCGLLVHQVPRVLEAYAAGFTMAPPQIRGDWALLSGVRR